jgi:hypothetical protein
MSGVKVGHADFKAGNSCLFIDSDLSRAMELGYKWHKGITYNHLQREKYSSLSSVTFA